MAFFLQPAFREDIRREGMVETIVKHLKRGDVPLKTLCATALFKVCDDSVHCTILKSSLILINSCLEKSLNLVSV